MNNLKSIEAAKIVGSTAAHGTAYLVGVSAGVLNKCADMIITADKDSILGMCRDRDVSTMYRKGRVDGYSAVSLKVSKTTTEQERE